MLPKWLFFKLWIAGFLLKAATVLSSIGWSLLKSTHRQAIIKFELPKEDDE